MYKDNMKCFPMIHIKVHLIVTEKRYVYFYIFTIERKLFDCEFWEIIKKM